MSTSVQPVFALIFGLPGIGFALAAPAGDFLASIASRSAWLPSVLSGRSCFNCACFVSLTRFSIALWSLGFKEMSFLGVATTVSFGTSASYA